MATSLKDLKSESLRKKGVRDSYDELAPQFAIARAIVGARVASGLTQVQLAKRMKTSQSFIARLEGGRVTPTMKTLLRIADATGTRAVVTLEPRKAA